MTKEQVIALWYKFIESDKVQKQSHVLPFAGRRHLRNLVLFKKGWKVAEMSLAYHCPFQCEIHINSDIQFQLTDEEAKPLAEAWDKRDVMMDFNLEEIEKLL